MHFIRHRGQTGPQLLDPTTATESRKIRRPVDGDTYSEPPARVDVLIVAGNARSLIANRGELIRALQDRGLRVAAAVPRVDFLPETHDLGIDVHLVDVARTATNPVQDLRYLIALWRLLRCLRPRVVFSYTAKPVVYGSLAARLAAVPGRYAMITGLGHAYTTETARTRAVRAVMNALYRVGLASCHEVFFQNPDDVAEFASAGILRDPSKVVRTNGSGVDTTRYPQRPLPDGPPMFLFIGRLLTEKGIAEFVDAATTVRAAWPDARFVAVGPHDPALPHAVSAEVLARWQSDGVVEFVGGVKDVRPWLEHCSVLVLPSYREGTPRSVLEAMSTGRAIITTDAPGCRETVVDGVNGILVPPRTSAPLAAAMERLFTQPDLIRSMARESRRIAEEKYEVTKVNRVILEAMGL